MVKLGQSVKDKITGFVGVVTARAEYISGCNQALCAPPASPDGSFKEPQWFDEQRLIDQGGEIITLDNGKTPGFDRAAPKR